jgi:hypothetical protein
MGIHLYLISIIAMKDNALLALLKSKRLPLVVVMEYMNK